MIHQQEHYDATQPNIHLAGRFIDSGEGFKIYTETYGDPNQPAVILTHGGYQSSQSWRKQVGELAKKWFVVTWDLPFHGLSGPDTQEEISRIRPKNAGSFLAAGMHAVIEAFRLRERGFSLVAWSWGGIATNDYLLTYGSQGLRGLVYVAALPDLFALYQCPQEVQELSVQLLGEKQQERIDAAFRFINLLQHQPPDLDAYLAMVGYHMQVCLRPYNIPWLTEVGRAGESLALLRESGCPLLCIHGAHDALIPVALSEEICTSVGTGQLLVYEDCGHSPFLEDPERFNADVDTFLSGVFRPSSLGY
jgi:non-heme chloroperoxidase